MAHEVVILTERDLRGLVPLDLAAVDVVERAFAALGSDGVVMPPIMSMDLAEAHGEVDVKAAFIPGFDQFAIKISTGFFDNPGLGLPSLNGLMALFSARTGLLEALLLDNGYLTDVRTAAAGAVAARRLAPEVETAGVIGAGLQARLQVEAAHLVRPFRRALVWGRDPAKAAECADDIARRLGIEARAEPDPGRLVADSQLVVTATPARSPVLKAEWLHPGLHVTAMGSDAEMKNELEPAALARADRYVVDRITQCARLGELRSALESRTMTMDDAVELGRIVAGQILGRSSPDEITICDLTGTGAQDTAIASHAFARSRRAGAGTTIAT